MAGICGIVDFTGAPVSRLAVERMADAAPYRSADGQASWAGPGAAFVFQALNVTPESVHEAQPLFDERTERLFVADARIDNRREIAEELRSLGIPCADSPTDLELIVAAYGAWGDAAAARLVGDFVIVVWDLRRRRLVVARDPMGMRSAAYHWDGRVLRLATEVKQVLAAPGVEAKIFEPAIAAHLLNDYRQAAWTPYEGILLLPAGHRLVVDEGGVRVSRFWDVGPPLPTRPRDERQLIEAFRDVFARAVEARMRCRGRVGVMLSGGLDSGSVAATAGWLVRQRGEDAREVRTYSWAFEQLQSVDERAVSEQIVDHYGLTSTSIAAEERWPLFGYPAHGPSRDGPFGGVYQALIEHSLAHARRDGVGVLLWGHRGDVVIGEAVNDSLGLLLHGRWRALFRELQVYRRWRRTSLTAAARTLLAAPARTRLVTRLPARYRRRTRRPEHHAAPWIQRAFLDRSALPCDEAATVNPVNVRGEASRQRHAMVFEKLVVTGVTWTERLHAEAGMAFADPWSDRRVAELVIHAPQWMVHRLAEPKRLAREAMRGFMPEGARTSARKVLPTPLFELAMQERAVDVVTHLLHEPVAAALGIVDGDELRSHFEAARTGGRLHPGFWQTLTLEMWLRAYHGL